MIILLQEEEPPYIAMPPLFPTFEPLGLKHKDYFRRYAELIELNSDYSFANLLVWNTNEQATVSQLNDMAVLIYPNYNNPDDSLCLVLGEGEMLLPSIAAVLDSGKASKVDLVPDSLFDPAKLSEHGLRAEPDRDSYDYVYLAKALAAAETSHYRHMRRGANVFKERHEGHLEMQVDIDTPSEAIIADIMEITEQWGMSRYDTKVYEEGIAIERALRHLDELDLKLAALLSDGKVIGFIIYEYIGKKDDTILIHFEKNANHNSLGHYLKKSFFERIVTHNTREITYINYEQDLGIEGLRTIKLSLNPHTLNKVSTIYRSAD